MYPFYNTNTNPLFPFPGFPFGFQNRGRRIPTLDNRGIYEVCTTGLLETAGETADYGINPCIWRQLPNQCVIVWKVKHPTTAAGAELPVTVVIPTTGSSTVNSSSSSSNAGGIKVPVIDNKGTQTVGSDVTNNQPTEHWVYIDKCSGIFRLMGVQAAAAPAPTA